MLRNESTKEEYEYELKGIGEEPLAEDHIVLTCKARETCTNIFEIKNTTDKQKLDPMLKQLAISTMLFVVLFGLGNAF